MIISKKKYLELVESVAAADKAVDAIKFELSNTKDENIRLHKQLAEYENSSVECQSEVVQGDCDKVAERKANLVEWINGYIVDDLSIISNKKLREFVASQISAALGTPMPTEFTTDIDDDALAVIDHVMYTALALDSHIKANGLTIRKK